MKKFFAVLLSAVLLVSMLAVAVSAASWKNESDWTVSEDGAVAFPNAYGYVFDIDYVDGTIAGEDATIVTSADAYAVCNPNWAISVALKATENANEYSVVKVVECPGSAAAAGIDWSATDIVMVVHSATSIPAEGSLYGNWKSKVAALALKAGDLVTVNADKTQVTVNDVDAGDEEVSEEESVPEVIVPAIDLDELLGEKNADAKFDAVFEIAGDPSASYHEGGVITLIVSVRNITAENGVHIPRINITYDPAKLSLLNDLLEEENNAVACINSVPNEDYENFTFVEYDFDEETEIATPKNDGLIKASVVYDKEDSAAKEDDEISFYFEFLVLDADGQTAIYAKHADVDGGANVGMEIERFAGNGGGVVLGEAPAAPETSEDTSEEAKPEAPEAMPFWVTHFNDLTAEGAGVIVTQSGLEGGTWNNYYAFAPVKDLAGVYEIVEVSIGIGTGTASHPAIPAGGFVYSVNVGNNWPEINADGSGINYTSDNCNAMCELVGSWAKGDKFVIDGVDFTGAKIPTSTSDKNWYDPAYKCTATITKYIGQDLGDVDTSNKPSTPATGDASSMIVFALLAVVAIAGSAVVIKNRK